MKYARALVVLIVLTCAGVVFAQESQDQKKPDQQQTKVAATKKLDPTKQAGRAGMKMACCSTDSAKTCMCKKGMDKCKKMESKEGNKGGEKK